MWPFLFPRHLRRSYRHFWMVLLCKELILAEDNTPYPPPPPHPHNCAAHSNILAQPRCSCWCQCLVVTQPKPSRGWLDQNMPIYCTFSSSSCGVCLLVGCEWLDQTMPIYCTFSSSSCGVCLHVGCEWLDQNMLMYCTADRWYRRPMVG